MIENHNSDTLANVYSNARNNYYNISGYPTYFFDGVLNVVGGNASSSMYGNYVPKVNARNAIMSDFTIAIEFEESDADYSATVTIDNVGGNTSTNLKLHFVVTESHLPISWGLTDEQNFVNRLMVPDQNGTPLDFTGGSTQTVTLNFSTESWWDTDNCELVAFVQDNSTKEIKQGTKVPLAVALYAIDAEAKEVTHPAGLFCGSSVEPIVVIKNMGYENLTSLDIEYSINGGSAQSFSWNGEIGFNTSEEIELPEISFVGQEVNTFDFSVSNPNGQPDPNPDNNILVHEFNASPQVPTSTIQFELMTDQYPAETSWDVVNSSGTTIYSGGPYSGANTLYTDTWELEEADCYTFTIYDSYGDGICCAYGNGFYKLMDENSTVLFEGGDFGSEEANPFERTGDEVLTADFTADATTIFEEESVNFSDLSSGGVVTIWYWEFEGGDPATSDEQNPTVIYMTEGMYDVSLTVSDGTSSNTMVKEDYIEVDHVVGIGNPVASEVKVFPNPSSGVVFVEGISNASITIYNTTGTIVKSIEEFNNGQINLSGFEEGIYFINITTKDGLTVSKKVSLLK